ncbi:MAG TPA: hypothetical protein VLI69_06280 [Gammaproteobacteria bacterium]|nr:hypothetical protein [Gammaproteobacteria bacterium]
MAFSSSSNTNWDDLTFKKKCKRYAAGAAALSLEIIGLGCVVAAGVGVGMAVTAATGGNMVLGGVAGIGAGALTAIALIQVLAPRVAQLKEYANTGRWKSPDQAQAQRRRDYYGPL